MKKLHFLFLLVGALIILGCKLPVGEGEDQQIALTVTASPTNGGTVTRSPDLTKYAYGTVVTLTAKPESAYQFIQWDGDATGSENPITITVDRGKTATAVFRQCSLVVWGSPSNWGTVTISPNQTQYEPGTVVTLTANPAPGYVFVRWEQGATGSESPTTITMNGARCVAAIFASDSLNLTVKVGRYVTKQWTEFPYGSVAVSPNQAKYKYGTVVTLTANPSPDFQFARWETVTTTYDIQSGEQKVATSSFSENPVTTITMDSDKTVRAVIIPAKPFIQPSQGLIDSDVVTGSTYLHPDLISIQITNDGIGTLSGLAVSFPHGKPGWLSATLSDSTAPATLTARFEDSVLVTVQSMPEGAQLQSLIQITSPVAMNSPQDIDVTVTHVSMPWTPPPGPGSPEPMKVICAELHRQGLMDEAIWKADEAFGSYLNDNHKDVLLGYQLWAKPVVKWMQKSKTLTRIVAAVVTPWSYEMAYRMGARSEGTFAGKILMDVGVPICRVIGRAMIWAGNIGTL